ncbi:hypothetical protein [Mucilaginibacter myungsuensis]|uniref:Uncharacterized protein n=1 Tax=Mucilaginibacter myungsuensis TaxID=649104 RepID=A0A929L7B3_9SPHI|nr:hypothetical protein [Mucilaginibacter myungsuensis]MBE9664501.1 hypothetical protein [Mucilaginibacter myungsuensis]MDN3601354.1 hypothetical protein [Mucilaginibacter myungsuensis]
MLRSVWKRTLKIVVLTGVVLVASAFKTEPEAALFIHSSNKILAQVYDIAGEVKLKKWELSVTEDHFLRLRKTFQTGKQEYFSLHLTSVADVAYLGNTDKGIIRINTKTDDVIVQTHGDKKGNVDSMATSFSIPLKNIQTEQLDTLYKTFQLFKSGGEEH